MKPTPRLSLYCLCLLVAACAQTPPSAPPSRFVPLAEAQAKSMLPHSSPECLARNLRPGEPFPAAAIPEAARAARQSGWVAVRYDVVAGAAQNLAVVASSPAGLYDAAALQHAARYREPTRTTVAGCVMTIDVKF